MFELVSVSFVAVQHYMCVTVYVCSILSCIVMLGLLKLFIVIDLLICVLLIKSAFTADSYQQVIL